MITVMLILTIITPVISIPTMMVGAIIVILNNFISPVIKTQNASLSPIIHHYFLAI